MTKKDALTIAISALTNDSYKNPNYDGKETTRETIPTSEIVETLQKMVEQLSKSHPMSVEAKIKRQEKTAAARSALMANVIPAIYAALSTEELTAKEIYEIAKTNLPADFTANKVQYVLLHELAEQVVKTEMKNKANTYRLA